MLRSKVSIIKLDDYQSENIARAIQKSLDLLGGLESIIKPRNQLGGENPFQRALNFVRRPASPSQAGHETQACDQGGYSPLEPSLAALHGKPQGILAARKVFVKINHLSPPSSPEKGIITHPSFTKEVLRLLQKSGVEITVGDDIQSGESDGFLLSGYRQVCRELGIHLVNLKEAGFREVNLNGQVLNKTYISQPVLEADYIINLPKLKTHSFAIYTGAIKNMFGIIPSGLRLAYHRQFIINEAFSGMLVDIFSCAKPHLTIMDGVVAMEGEGPSAGRLRKAGVILASCDAVSLDAVASSIIGFSPGEVYTTLIAHQRELGKGEIGQIEILGEALKAVTIKDFKHSAISLSLFRNRIPSFLYGYFSGQLILIPEVWEERCTACLECIKICPAGAARLIRDKARIDRESCIHCLCCHEVCRSQAILLRQLPLGKIMRGISTLSKKLKSLLP